MNKIEDLVKELAPATDKKPKTYTAEVSHTDEEGIVWVRLPGAEEDTPTASSSTDVKMGDTVNVEWRNNKLYIAGNYTNPSAGVERVVKVDMDAQAGIKEAKETAGDALSKANKQVQYFWTDEDGVHVTKIPKDDFIENPAGGNTLTDSDGFDVRDGETSLAKFGKQTRIGQTDQSHIEMDYHSLQLRDKEGNPYFHVSDLRDENGEYAASETHTYEQPQNRVYVRLSPILRVSNLTVDDNDWISYITEIKNYDSPTDPSNSSSYVLLSQNVPAGAKVVIEYVATSQYLKALTFGTRADKAGEHYKVGPYSTCTGYLNSARGFYGHSEGFNCSAYGIASHSEGADTTADGDYCHSEGHDTTASGLCSHAEGSYTTASGVFSHAEGYSTTASGEHSYAAGRNTTAGYDSQTVIGKYNDNQQNNAFEIGNGTADDARSNAFEVDWDGNTAAAGTITVGGHSSPIGDIRVRGMENDTVVHTATGTALCALTLPAGAWSLVAYVRFPSNNTGVRRANISTDRASNALQMQLSPTQGGVTQFQVCNVVTITSETTYYLNVYHTAGVDLTLPAGTSDGYINGIRAVRIA